MLIPPGLEGHLRGMLAPPGIEPWTPVDITVGESEAVARFRQTRTRAMFVLRLTGRSDDAVGVLTRHFCLRFSVTTPDDTARSLRAILLRSVRAREAELVPEPPRAAPRDASPPPPEATSFVPERAGEPLEHHPTAAAPRASDDDACANPSPPEGPHEASTWAPPTTAATLVQRLRPVFHDLALGFEPTVAAEWSSAEFAAACPDLREALRAAANGDHRAAREAVRRAVARAPALLSAALVSALAFDALGDVDRAVAELSDLAGRSDPHRRHALAARFALERRVGWFNEAARTLEEALGREPDDVPLLRAGASLFEETHHHERADLLLARVMSRSPDDVDAVAARARLSLRAGDHPAAVALRDHLGATTARDPARVLAAASLSIALGDFDDAEARAVEALAIDAGGRDARRMLATLRLWRGDDRAAEALLEGDEGAPRLRGITQALRGAYAAALACFDDALRRDPRDAEAHVWRAEALLHLGRAEDAVDAAVRGGDVSPDGAAYLAAELVRAVAQIRVGRLPGLSEQGPHSLLALLAPTPAPLEHQILVALRALRGNRGLDLTWLDDAGALRAIPSAPSARQLAKHAVVRYALTASVEASARDFAAIKRRWPELPEPNNYEGEVHLYAGDTAAARRCFEAALGLYEQSRWAFIGLMAVAVLEGRYEDGLAVMAEGVRRGGPEGPTAFAYRGEAYRALGRAAPARSDLTHAVQLAPSRVGAWVNLGLLCADEGDARGLDEALRAIRAHAPCFIADAARSMGVDLAEAELPAHRVALLRRGLTLLRGNRASSCVTWFSPEGALRTGLTRAALHDPSRVIGEVLSALPGG